MTSLFKTTSLILIVFLIGFNVVSTTIMETHSSRLLFLNGTLADFRKAQLAKHNSYRKTHHVGNLKLDDTLNKYAQNWAEHLASTGQFSHSRGKYGENLYYTWSSNSRPYKYGAATDSWYSQVKDYDYSSGGFTSGTGHFTQLVWKASTKVGFGIATGSDGSDYIVASYDPAGNYNGQYSQNVLKP